MMRSLYTAISGLTNHQTKMDVIGNNIANINTTGFKSNRATFADTLSQTISGSTASTDNLGGTNPQQVGLGMAVSSIDTDFSAGSPTSTGKNTDLAIASNNGLFVVKNGDATYYTRNGNFTLDGSGNLVMNSGGYKVQGWNATDGVLSSDGEPQDLHIDMNSTFPPQATSYSNLGKNLSADSDASTVTKIILTVEDANGKTQQVTVPAQDTATPPNPNTTKYNIGDPYAVFGGMPAITGGTIKNIQMTLADDTVTSGVYGHTGGYGFGDATFPGFTSMMTVYDSLGSAHSIPIMFERITSSVQADGTAVAAGEENQWMVSIPAGTYDGITSAGQTATIRFDGTGKLDTTDPSTYATNMAAAFTVPYPNGASLNESVSMDFGALTQYAGETSANVIERDGYAPGVYKDMAIGSDGVITLTYSNGQKQAAGVIALANFNNPGGLEKQGGSLYAVSNNSGDPQIGTAEANGISLTPGNLEMSNVNTAREFSEMITTQRGFQANSKIITVSDEMLETLVNMKR